MAKGKTQYLKFKGLCAWARIWEGQEDDYNGQKHWKLNFYPTKEVAEKIKEAGIQSKLKDDDGEKSGVSGKYFVFKRDVEREFDGVKNQLKPVRVLGTDGKVLDERVSIGNGSTVEITLEVYQTRRFGKGSRLQEVRIIDLIEYNPPEEEEKESEDLSSDEELPVEEENGKKKIRW